MMPVFPKFRVMMMAGFLLLHAMALAGTDFTEKMYRRALTDAGTAPLYVLITLRDVKADSSRVVCIEAPFLLGAIATEQHLSYGDAGIREQLRIALDQPDREFSFSNPKALQNIQPRYTLEVLSKDRRLLEGRSRAELLKEVDVPDSDLQRIYFSKSGSPDYEAYRDAVAHVLLEHGIQVGIGDMTGGLYVAK
jgi:hypothetical protein